MSRNLTHRQTQYIYIYIYAARGTTIYRICTVLKTGPDRPVRPVQRGMGASPVRLKASKPINNRKTGQKQVKNRGWTRNLKKNGSIPGSVFKTMRICSLIYVICKFYIILEILNLHVNHVTSICFFFLFFRWMAWSTCR